MGKVHSKEGEAYLTPPEVARLLRVASGKVLGWIRRGELRAVNVGNKGRPRFRVGRNCLDVFLAAREVRTPPPSQPTKKWRRPEGGPLDAALGKTLLKLGQAVEVCGRCYRVWDGMILFY